MRRALVALATLGLAVGSGLAVLLLADRLVGRLVDPRFTPLAGTAHADTVLARPEFRVPVRTNAAGFRGPALPGAKPAGVYRIVALGDSFTFGFGVRERQAWPARLAALLDARTGGTPRVEVVNLGVPGTGPRDYLWHLAHTGLALQPDLVVIGFFANDVNDVYQLDRFGMRSPLFALAALQNGGLAPRPWWKRAADATLPNLYALGARTTNRLASAGPGEAHAAAREVASAPAADPATMIAALGARYGRRDAVVARYRSLPARDRATLDAFLAGAPLGEDMRPALLLAALVDPDAEADGVLLRSEERRQAWNTTAALLRRIVRLARSAGAETAIAVMPASEQVDRARWPVLEDVGFRLDPAMLSDTAEVDAVRHVAVQEGATVVDLVEAFRAHRDAGLYFRLDEHWNARGQGFAAARIAAAVTPHIRGEGRSS
ncbi:MAG TPA: GDSL-type esterase/lipase family protein [Candidatus Binatia bacterium]|nr:GDSL-type esterase/lipase family protein [Candidatus Binatia bacterium]